MHKMGGSILSLALLPILWARFLASVHRLPTLRPRPMQTWDIQELGTLD
jgi:hypothetical protein